MSFDTSTRNRLASFVGKCRAILCGDFKTPGGEMARLLAHYGIQDTGECFEVDSLTHLDEPGRETAHTLRELLAHKQANAPSAKVWGKFDPAVYDLIQEQGFTVLNRLCALRMAEERKILQFPCISKGLQSDGFELYEYHTGKANADISKEDRFQHFIFSLFDELSLDLGSLFDRFNPQGLIFPEPSVLNELLEEINHPDLAPLWAEDETIGWIYQYWNSKEERKAMRDASAAPRNSRELAVRNQFFTPRYVVEFLTDNTLGRIWYEMTKGETRLAEQCRYLVRRPTETFLAEGETAPTQHSTLNTQNSEEALSQEELLKQTVYIEHRELKDPREIRLLDPACGSMHFGLYAFDLFEVIYSEYWELNIQNSKLKTLYASKEAYMLDVPRLIIENNIHGVDIDPRAVQIAGLSLWLRAQKTWKDTPAAGRPRVRRSNIVCAEPMPGSDAMLEDFVQTLDPPLLGELVKTVFDKMQLAGEAGTLLKIEEEIRTAIDDAKAKWEKLGAADRDLFSAEELNQTLRPRAQQELTGVEKALATDHRPLATDFFDSAEERIYAALRDYAESAEAGDYQRRLFAEDAAHGFAFIDLCRKRYDAVVMNPPFGEACGETKKLLSRSYPDQTQDIYCLFVTRGWGFAQRGLVGAITSNSFIRYTDYSDYRSSLTDTWPVQALFELGWEVLDDAYVNAATYFLAPEAPSQTIFGDATAASDKESLIRDVLNSVRDGSGDSSSLFIHPIDRFGALEGTPFCYSLPDRFFSWVKTAPKVRDLTEDNGIGAGPHNFFFRLAWELPSQSLSNPGRWPVLTNGGPFSPFYRDHSLRIDWKGDGSQIKEHLNVIYPYLKGNVGIKIQREHVYFKAGITYGKRTDRFNAQILPAGMIPSFEGIGVYPTDDSDIWWMLGYLNTRSVAYYLNLTCGLHKNSVYIDRIPVPDFSDADKSQLASNATALFQLVRSTNTTNETSDFFLCPIPISNLHDSLESAYATHRRIERTAEMHAWELEIGNEQIVAKHMQYGEAYERELSGDQGILPPLSTNEPAHPKLDSTQLAPSLKARARPLLTRASYLPATDLSRAIFDTGLNVRDATEQLNSESYLDPGELLELTVGIPQWAIGSAFGRWDIRYATGERQPPELPDPFDPLPVCPPGMLQNADGLPLEKAESGKLKAENYPLEISWEGILVDDDGHPEDIVTRVRDALAVIWGDRSAAIEQEACEILGVGTLRDYFAEKKSGGKFFKDHLKRYSKSRRQAPIYWPLSTESGSYTLWIYYHRLTENTLYSAVTQFIEPKQEDAAKTYANLSAKKDRTKAEDKELESVQLLVAELATFRESLLEIAKFWKPNLNDGVQITAAPLWKHFRLKTWQKKLKDTWQKLEAGDYDWAHLAHSTWPERVIPKCVTDRSLAIAHGHDEALWEEVKNDKGKLVWQPKKDAEEIAQKLIKNHQ
jgi:hypothetical protein